MSVELTMHCPCCGIDSPVQVSSPLVLPEPMLHWECDHCDTRWTAQIDVQQYEVSDGQSDEERGDF